ncbi:hypothetical protein NWFMUON74_38610 [Nocardia wallacei]|uniref:Uncharacterized protein n=1 Tax=Nocardia wallacei TaxID=480035 RepID=A0A7G1KQE4_9NOCA|nr:hypothetical protein NWFMUON74_38610 [Nocardia wallacei]
MLRTLLGEIEIFPADELGNGSGCQTADVPALRQAEDTGVEHIAKPAQAQVTDENGDSLTERCGVPAQSIPAV